MIFEALHCALSNKNNSHQYIAAHIYNLHLSIKMEAVSDREDRKTEIHL